MNNIICWLFRFYCNDDVLLCNVWFYFIYKILCLWNFWNLFFEIVFFNDLIIKIINCYVIFRIIGLDWGGDELD